MTQEVQPLTWQKRTNLEEHQQFFAKINEIIANLAPTVNEAEAAIAQATQAIASANSAIALRCPALAATTKYCFAFGMSLPELKSPDPPA